MSAKDVTKKMGDLWKVRAERREQGPCVSSSEPRCRWHEPEELTEERRALYAESAALTRSVLARLTVGRPRDSAPRSVFSPACFEHANAGSGWRGFEGTYTQGDVDQTTLEARLRAVD